LPDAPAVLSPHIEGKSLSKYYGASSFNMDAWQCLYELIDTEFHAGFAVFRWFDEYCVQSGRIKGAVTKVESVRLTHQIQPSSFSDNEFARQKEAWQLRGVKLTRGGAE
jgi:hypothetical protein